MIFPTSPSKTSALRWHLRLSASGASHQFPQHELLFDENLSPLLPDLVADLFPLSRHVRQVGLLGADDSAIWEHAAANDFAIVTKNDDFRQMAVLRGPPPKVVWLTIGNCTTSLVSRLLRQHHAGLLEFHALEHKSLVSIGLT